MKMLGSGSCVGIVRFEDAGDPPPCACQGTPRRCAGHLRAIVKPLSRLNLQSLHQQAPYHLRRLRHSRAQPPDLS